MILDLSKFSNEELELLKRSFEVGYYGGIFIDLNIKGENQPNDKYYRDEKLKIIAINKLSKIISKNLKSKK